MISRNIPIDQILYAIREYLDRGYTHVNAHFLSELHLGFSGANPRTGIYSPRRVDPEDLSTMDITDLIS